MKVVVAVVLIPPRKVCQGIIHSTFALLLEKYVLQLVCIMAFVVYYGILYLFILFYLFFMFLFLYILFFMFSFKVILCTLFTMALYVM